MKIQKNNYPWNHYIVDDFLSEERFDYINKLVLDEKKYLDMFGYYSRSNHYYRFDEKDILPELNDLYDHLFPDRNKSLKKINHWSIHPENFTYHTHVDNESRLYTSVLYISPEPNCGTILCKNDSEFKKDHQLPDKETEDEIEIEFKPNRLFLHESTPNSWHRYFATNKRVTLNSFLVNPELIAPGRMDKNFLIDIE